MCIQANLWNTVVVTEGAPCYISFFSLSIDLYMRRKRKIAATITHVTTFTSQLLSVSNNAVIGRLPSSDTTFTHFVLHHRSAEFVTVVAMMCHLEQGLRDIAEPDNLLRYNTFCFLSTYRLFVA